MFKVVIWKSYLINALILWLASWRQRRKKLIVWLIRWKRFVASGQVRWRPHHRFVASGDWYQVRWRQPHRSLWQVVTGIKWDEDHITEVCGKWWLVSGEMKTMPQVSGKWWLESTTTTKKNNEIPLWNKFLTMSDYEKSLS